MPLDKNTLKTGIQSLLADMRTRDENADEEYAERLSNLIETFVKSGDAKYVIGSLQQSGTTAVVSATGVIAKIE